MVTRFAREIERAARRDPRYRWMTLVRVTPGARGATLTAGTALVTATYRCRGRRVAKTNATKDPAANKTRTAIVEFAILGATLPDGIEPRAGDRATWGGVTYAIEADATNDDGEGAVWTFAARPMASG